jgi:DNA-binding MarR family transcriptional regulator
MGSLLGQRSGQGLEWFNPEQYSSTLNQMTAARKVRPPAASPHGTRSWLAVVRAYNLCDAVMSARLGALGVRVGEHEVLANLYGAPGITQQDLAARCFVAKSGISMLLTRMQAQRRVRREVDAADARARRLFLTAAGEKLARRTMQVQAEVVAAMAQTVSGAELAAVADVMQRVSARLEELREAPRVSRASAPRSPPRPPARRG